MFADSSSVFRQLEWLKLVLGSCPVDDAETLLEMNSRGEYSVRQAIRLYLTKDTTSKLVNKWEPTGVFFEMYQLTWRDCFFLPALADQYSLLNATPPPCSMEKFGLYDFPNQPDVLFEDPTADDDHNFAQAMAAMREDGPGHCKFTTN